MHKNNVHVTSKYTLQADLLDFSTPLHHRLASQLELRFTANTHTHTCTQHHTTHTHTCTQHHTTHTHTHMHTASHHTHSITHTHMHTASHHTHTHTHAHSITHTHTHMHTASHTHTHYMHSCITAHAPNTPLQTNKATHPPGCTTQLNTHALPPPPTHPYLGL